jgi:transcriptional regulator with XRE-family HTH domain
MSESVFEIPQWTLGDRLRKAREDRGITVAEMAVEVERSERTIRNYETGATRARSPIIRRYAMRTGVPYSWFITGQPPTDVPPNTPASECYPGLVAA